MSSCLDAQQLPLANLFVTDLSRLGHIDEEDMNDDCKVQEGREGDKPAYAIMLENAKQLKLLGCQLDKDDLPFNKVSGFEVHTPSTNLRNPGNVLPKGKKVGLLFWGSPHPNPSSCDGSNHGSREVGSGFKTNAFESMAWLAPGAFVAMTFPVKYMVEFYQPLHHAQAQSRTLIVAKAHVRSYKPMVSSHGYRYTIPIESRDGVVVAMLVPFQLLQSVVFLDDAIDVGRTLLNVLQGLPEDEKGVALGCYDLSLEMELVHAAKMV